MQQHSTVVRLKGGDPCVFGRGGEDVEFLTAHRIPWEVIPGISAGIGGLSLLGLPVTHRGLSSAVTLLTGSRESAETFEGFPAEAIRSTAHTLVFYMSFRYVADIAQHLIQHGRSPDTYALCASWLSYPQQKIVTAPLAHINAAVLDAQISLRLRGGDRGERTAGPVEKRVEVLADLLRLRRRRGVPSGRERG